MPAVIVHKTVDVFCGQDGAHAIMAVSPVHDWNPNFNLSSEKGLAMKKLMSYLLVLTTLAMLTVTFTVNTTAAAAWDGIKTDTAWYNTTDTQFTLATPAQVAGLAAIVNGKAAGIAADNFAGKPSCSGQILTWAGMTGRRLRPN